MKEYKRPVFNEIRSRLSTRRKFIQVITGPRQTGKTTLIGQLLKELKTPSLYISADYFDGDGTLWIEKHWDAARLKYSQTKARQLILAIDEIQKIPDWSSVVKKMWDEDTRQGTAIKLIISGSSDLLLKKGIHESLAGRFETFYLNHWSYPEMREAFGFSPEEYVWFGGYPGSAELTRDEYRWKKYVFDSLIETSISKDILMMTRIDKPALLRRLFDIGCAYSGQVLSYTKMLGQLQDAGNTVTLAHYLDLLDSAGLLSGISKFSGSMVRQRSSSPKLMVRNTALISARSDESFKTIIKMKDKWVRLVESSVGAHLLNGQQAGNYRLYYWRQGNDEIDFVMEGKKKLIGLEIQSGISHKRSGMDAFVRAFKPDKVLLIGGNGLSWQEFLRISPGEMF